MMRMKVMIKMIKFDRDKDDHNNNNDDADEDNNNKDLTMRKTNRSILFQHFEYFTPVY
jgi:hypothetical protein